jgi:hypothetical protein
MFRCGSNVGVCMFRTYIDPLLNIQTPTFYPFLNIQTLTFDPFLNIQTPTLDPHLNIQTHTEMGQM